MSLKVQAFNESCRAVKAEAERDRLKAQLEALKVEEAQTRKEWYEKQDRIDSLGLQLEEVITIAREMARLLENDESWDEAMALVARFKAIDAAKEVKP